MKCIKYYKKKQSYAIIWSEIQNHKKEWAKKIVQFDADFKMCMYVFVFVEIDLVEMSLLDVCWSIYIFFSIKSERTKIQMIDVITENMAESL